MMLRIRRHCLLLFLISLVPLYSWAQGKDVLSKPCNTGTGMLSVRAVFNILKKNTGVSISYSNSLLNPSRKINLTGKEKTIGEILTLLIDGINAEVIVRGEGNILIVPRGTVTPSYHKRNIDGYIKDAETKEVLIGCIVYALRDHKSAATNSYGFYSLALNSGLQQFVIMYPGYKRDTVAVDPAQQHRLDVLLRQSDNSLNEVKITGNRNDVKEEGDHTHLSNNDILTSQAVLGEKDVLRSLQMQPGVQQGVEGSSSITVRGGDPGQNLYLLDGIPLYYVDHFYGLTSVYNAQAIKSVDFYKGAFPSRYSGRISSIVDVHTKDGDMQRIGGEFTLGMVKATLNLEGPIVKDKVSFMVAARRSWIDAIISPLTPLSMYFYDVNAKLNWIVNKNNRVYVSFYSGRDQIKYGDADYSRTRWGNTVASFKWNSILSSKFFLNTTVTYSEFRYEIKEYTQTDDSAVSTKINDYLGLSTINEIAAHVQGQWFPHYRHSVEIGAGYSYSKFTPTKLVSTGSSKVPVPVNPVSNNFSANEINAYAEDEIKLTDKILLRPGLHFVRWFNADFGYNGLQPRFFASYSLGQKQQLTFSASYMTQFLHLISNNSYGLPNDFWIPSTSIIHPEKSWQGTLGYNGRVNRFKYSAEGYYKKIDGVITYTTGKNIFDNSDRWQNKIIQGKGWSYGGEFSAENKFGPIQVFAAYTLSWNWRQFAQINNGDPFPYRYDRRHVIKAGISYERSKKFNVGFNWTYMSGEAFTLPDQIYPDLDNSLYIFPSANYNTANFTYNYVKWNDYRLPAIHHLDVVFNFVKSRGKHYERTWSVGIYNLYARPNVMFVTLKQNSAGAFELKGISALRFVPFFSYQMKF